MREYTLIKKIKSNLYIFFYYLYFLSAPNALTQTPQAPLISSPKLVKLLSRVYRNSLNSFFKLALYYIIKPDIINYNIILLFFNYRPNSYSVIFFFFKKRLWAIIIPPNIFFFNFSW